MKLSEIIISYRHNHDLSQRQFAAQCGVSNGYISMLENEKNPKTGLPVSPQLPKLKMLANGMGMSLQSLLALADDLDVDMSFGDINNDISSDNSEATIPEKLPSGFTPYRPMHRIPILGRISAGLPLYADEHIEGYTYTDLNGGAEYFALRVSGDSMNAARIYDGDLLIVRRQDIVDNGDIAVVLVGDEDATVKRFYREGTTITLMPQSTNPAHQPQIYDSRKTRIRIQGRVVRNEIVY